MPKGCGHGHQEQCSCAWEAKEQDVDHGGTLYPFINRDNVRGLNESKKDSARLCIKPWVDRKDAKEFVRSVEGDGELIVFVPFTAQVKLKSFCVIGGDEGSAPSAVRVWKNRDDIDFENADDIDCDQEFNLAVDGDGSIQYPVKIRKFQGVSSLTFFFTGSHDEDTTQVNYLGLKGQGTKNKRGIVTAVYEARALESDHKSLLDQHVSKTV